MPIFASVFLALDDHQIEGREIFWSLNRTFFETRDAVRRTTVKPGSTSMNWLKNTWQRPKSPKACF